MEITKNETYNHYMAWIGHKIVAAASMSSAELSFSVSIKYPGKF